MTDIFREIDEDIRRDRLFRFAERHGLWIVAGLVLIVALTAAYVAWSDRQRARYEHDGLAFGDAVAEERAGAGDAAIKSFAALAHADSRGYALLARLEIAEIRAKGLDPASGLADLQAIAEDRGIDPDYRDLARLVWGLFALDREPPATVAAALQPLATGSSPWRYTAIEIEAIAALRSGDRKTAHADYLKLSDDLAAPRSLRARAAEIVADWKAEDAHAQVAPLPSASRALSVPTGKGG